MEISKNNQKKIVKLQKKKVKCLNCQNKSHESFAPFCSNKCSDLDLIKWLSDENYINLDS
jgi:endogenous inhibitor of DNA gyrase (YacG/DUF329 family)